MPRKRYFFGFMKTPSKALLPFTTMLLFLMVATGCGYRIVSKVQSAPKGGETVAVLPVIDSSHSSFPVSHLWKAVQKKIFSSTKLSLARPENSEALLQVELLKASTSPAGIVINKDLNADGEDISKNPDLNSRASTPDFQNYKSLEVAGEYSSDEMVSLKANIKVWNRVTKKLLFSKSYSLSESILSTEGIGTDAVEYLLYRERAEAEIKTLSGRIADHFIADYLGTLRF